MLTSLFTLIGGVKGVIIIALLAALGGYIALQHHHVTVAEAERDTALAQRDMAAGERDKAISAAQTNAATITKLESERDLANQALNSLQAARDTIKNSSATRSATIQKQAALPANTALAAPVLGTLIFDIQNDRIIRRGGVPVTAAVKGK